MLQALRSRTIKYGSNAFVSVIVVLGIVVLVNYLFNTYRYRYDATPGKIHSLSDQTITVLRGLDQDVNVTAFFKKDEGPAFADMLKECRYHSKKLSYEFIDPDQNPAMAKRYGIRVYGTTVIESGEREEKIESQEEKDLTNALIKVTRDRNKVIYFTQGHGEADIDEEAARDGYAQVRDRLQDVNYDVKKIVLAQEGQIPADCAALIAVGPKTAFFPNEVGLISTYLDRGGSGMFLIDPVVQSGLEDMLRAWSVEVGNDFVVDYGIMAQLFGVRDRAMPVTTTYGEHPITEKHKGMMTFYPLVRSVSLADQTGEGATGVELIQTSAQSWAETDLSALAQTSAKIAQGPGDTAGPISLAVAVTSEARMVEGGAQEGGKKNRIVVFGDSEFANNQFFTQQGNGDLFLNAVSWLVEEEELISIRPKGPRFSPISLTARDGKVIFWLSVVMMPLIVAAAGVVVWWRRR